MVQILELYMDLTKDGKEIVFVGVPGQLLTIKHILLTCSDLIEIRKSHFTAQSLRMLFQEI